MCVVVAVVVGSGRVVVDGLATEKACVVVAVKQAADKRVKENFMMVMKGEIKGVKYWKTE
jgi:hypothetical protein